ncbi:MAG TPA: antitoxin family protein [Pyrinomonadaceae bacterium]|jgi:predicted DNA-binding antitoxin AbrB/MazE fold protein
MSQTLKAIYRDGTFIPQTPCDLPEGSEVELTVRAPQTNQPPVTDLEERKRILKEIVENMRANTLPADAPRRFTREELHERR